MSILFFTMMMINIQACMSLAGYCRNIVLHFIVPIKGDTGEYLILNNSSCAHDMVNSISNILETN